MVVHLMATSAILSSEEETKIFQLQVSYLLLKFINLPRYIIFNFNYVYVYNYLVYFQFY